MHFVDCLKLFHYHQNRQVILFTVLFRTHRKSVQWRHHSTTYTARPRSSPPRKPCLRLKLGTRAPARERPARWENICCSNVEKKLLTLKIFISNCSTFSMNTFWNTSGCNKICFVNMNIFVGTLMQWLPRHFLIGFDPISSVLSVSSGKFLLKPWFDIVVSCYC